MGATKSFRARKCALDAAKLSLGASERPQVELERPYASAKTLYNARSIAIFFTFPDWIFLLTPTLAGALVIVTLGIGCNNPWRDRSYPTSW